MNARFSLDATLVGVGRSLAAHPVLFLGLAVVSQLPALAASVLILPRFYAFVGFGHVVVAGWVTALVASGAVRHARGERVTLGGCFRTWWRRPLASLGLAILPFILMIGVVPGPLPTAPCWSLAVLLLPALYLALPAALAENLGLVRAVERSWRLTRGHRWSLLLVLVATVAAAFVFGLPSYFFWSGSRDDIVWLALSRLSSASKILSFGLLTVAAHGELSQPDGLSEERIADTAAVFD